MAAKYLLYQFDFRLDGLRNFKNLTLWDRSCDSIRNSQMVLMYSKIKIISEFVARIVHFMFLHFHLAKRPQESILC
jgi:hypothetical protein